MLVLIPNKTKMVALLRTKGYTPTVKRARFQKGNHSGWLTWYQPEGMYTAYLAAVAGKPHLMTRYENEEKHIVLTKSELQSFGLIKEIGGQLI